MSEDDFKTFLKLLSPDEEEAGRLYIRLQEKLIRLFELKGVSDPEGAVFQCLDRAAKKMAEGAIVPDAFKYCFGIARNVVMEQRRRDIQGIESLRKAIQDWVRDFPEQVDRIYHLLLPCFEELDTADRKLLVDYCGIIRGRARAEHRRHLAEQLRTTVLGLRMRVTRLRAVLKDCVKHREKED